MKTLTKLSFLILLICISVTAVAKPFYEFAFGSGVTYKDLTNPTVLSTDDWTTLNIEGTLPFDFKVFDSPVTNFTISVDEGITFFGEYKWGSAIPFKAEIQSRGGNTSPISYQLEGTTPNRILKFEFKNVGFKNDIDMNGTSTDYANYQVWLYEGSDKIEYHYGVSNESFGNVALAGKEGPNVGFLGHNLFEQVGFYLIGNADNPQVTVSKPEYNLATWPMDDMVYEMKPSFSTNSVKSVVSNDIVVYPNPFKDEVTIELSATNNKIEIVDVTGKVVYTNAIKEDRTTIKTTDLNKGVYFIVITNSEGRLTKKIVKN